MRVMIRSDGDDLAGAWLGQEVAEMFARALEPGFGGGGGLFRLVLTTLFNKTTIQLDQFLAVLLLDGSPGLRPLFLDSPAIGIEPPRRGRG